MAHVLLILFDWTGNHALLLRKENGKYTLPKGHTDNMRDWLDEAADLLAELGLHSDQVKGLEFVQREATSLWNNRTYSMVACTAMLKRGFDVTCDKEHFWIGTTSPVWITTGCEGDNAVYVRRAAKRLGILESEDD